MSRRRAALALLAVQLALVLTIAGKYLYERQTCPRVWAVATQFDPGLPLRGRYLALQLHVNACSLPRDPGYFVRKYYGETGTPQTGWNWDVSLEPVNGRLEARLQDHLLRSGRTQHITLAQNARCDRVPIEGVALYFIPDRAQGPFPLKPGQELWVEVTLPPIGPPRPIQLALSTKTGFQPLKFE